MIENVVIVDAVPSAVGRAHKGTLAQTRPDELAGQVIAALLARVPQVKPSDVEELVLGCAMPEGAQGLNVARPEAMRRCAEVYTAMGITAENVAKKFSISRQDQDAFSLKSQQKAAAAIKADVFKDEIVPVKATRYVDGKHTEVEFKKDELPRADTTLEGLAALKPSFSKDGSVTPGNASPLSDGAAAALVMSKAKADSYGIKPLGYFRAFATAGVDPALMGIGPIPAGGK